METSEIAMNPSVADKFLYLYRDMIVQAFEPLQTFSLGIFWFVTMLSVAQLVTEMVATDGQGFEKLLQKFATMAFYHILIVNFPQVIGLIQSVMIQIGLGMGGGRLTTDQFLLPSRTLDVGIRASGEIWAYGDSLCTGIYSCTVNSGTMFLLHIVCIAILVLFGLAACMVIVAQLVFQLHALWALATMGTLMDSRLAWIGSKGMAGVFANALKLGVLATLVSLADGAFLLMDFTSGTLSAMFVLFVVFMAIFMIWQSSSLAAGVINGGPMTGGESLIGMAASTIVGMTGVGSLANAGANKIGNAGQRMRARSGGGGGGQASLPAPSSGGTGGSGGGGGGGSAWDQSPTPKQVAAAQGLGLDVSGMSRGQASVALEKGGLDPSWYHGQGNNAFAGPNAKVNSTP